MPITESISQLDFRDKELPSPLGALKKALAIGNTPSEVIHREANLSLLRYKGAGGTPILLIPSLINRHYILDLLPGKSLVEFLLSSGFAVYLIRWETPEDEERWLTADRLIGGRIHRAVSAVIRDSGHDQIQLAGQCLGGTLAAAYAIRYPERIRRLALLTTPVDFKPAGLLGKWANSSVLDLDALLDAYGNMPWALMQTAFQLLKPTTGMTKYLRAVRKIGDKAFLRNFTALEIWANDNVSFPGSCYRTIIQTFYRENGLITGALSINGKSVRLDDLQVPVLNLCSTGDHIVPLETTLQAEHLKKEAEFSLLQSDGGHIGCLLSKRAQNELWPRIAQWLN